MLARMCVEVCRRAVFQPSGLMSVLLLLQHLACCSSSRPRAAGLHVPLVELPKQSRLLPAREGFSGMFLTLAVCFYVYLQAPYLLQYR
jgi:hypothetical protein